MENVERKWTLQNKGVKNSWQVPVLHSSVDCGERFGPTCVMVNGIPFQAASTVVSLCTS